MSNTKKKDYSQSSISDYDDSAKSAGDGGSSDARKSRLKTTENLPEQVVITDEEAEKVLYTGRLLFKSQLPQFGRNPANVNNDFRRIHITITNGGINRYASAEALSKNDSPAETIGIANAVTTLINLKKSKSGIKRLKIELPENDAYVYFEAPENEILELRKVVEYVSKKWGAKQVVQIQYEIASCRKQIGLLWDLCPNGEITTSVQTRMNQIQKEMQIKDDLLSILTNCQQRLADGYRYREESLDIADCSPSEQEVPNQDYEYEEVVQTKKTAAHDERATIVLDAKFLMDLNDLNTLASTNEGEKDAAKSVGQKNTISTRGGRNKEGPHKFVPHLRLGKGKPGADGAANGSPSASNSSLDNAAGQKSNNPGAKSGVEDILNDFISDFTPQSIPKLGSSSSLSNFRQQGLENRNSPRIRMNHRNNSTDVIDKDTRTTIANSNNKQVKSSLHTEKNAPVESASGIRSNNDRTNDKSVAKDTPQNAQKLSANQLNSTDSTSNSDFRLYNGMLGEINGMFDSLDDKEAKKQTVEQKQPAEVTAQPKPSQEVKPVAEVQATKKGIVIPPPPITTAPGHPEAVKRKPVSFDVVPGSPKKQEASKRLPSAQPDSAEARESTNSTNRNVFGDIFQSDLFKPTESNNEDLFVGIKITPLRPFSNELSSLEGINSPDGSKLSHPERDSNHMSYLSQISHVSTIKTEGLSQSFPSLNDVSKNHVHESQLARKIPPNEAQEQKGSNGAIKFGGVENYEPFTSSQQSVSKTPDSRSSVNNINSAAFPPSLLHKKLSKSDDKLLNFPSNERKHSKADELPGRIKVLPDLPQSRGSGINREEAGSSELFSNKSAAPQLASAGMKTNKSMDLGTSPANGGNKKSSGSIFVPPPPNLPPPTSRNKMQNDSSPASSQEKLASGISSNASQGTGSTATNTTPPKRVTASQEATQYQAEPQPKALFETNISSPLTFDSLGISSDTFNLSSLSFNESANEEQQPIEQKAAPLIMTLKVRKSVIKPSAPVAAAPVYDAMKPPQSAQVKSYKVGLEKSKLPPPPPRAAAPTFKSKGRKKNRDNEDDDGELIAQDVE